MYLCAMFESVYVRLYGRESCVLGVCVVCVCVRARTWHVHTLLHTHTHTYTHTHVHIHTYTTGCVCQDKPTHVGCTLWSVFG